MRTVFLTFAIVLSVATVVTVAQAPDHEAVRVPLENYIKGHAIR
jgi:hypothetical protein